MRGWVGFDSSAFDVAHSASTKSTAERERERERERETDRERECVCVCEREREEEELCITWGYIIVSGCNST